MSHTADIGALFRSNGFDKRIFVTFDQLSAFNYARTKLSGDRIGLRCEADHLHLSTAKADWFQTEELFQVLPIMQKICARYDEVILYGQSMGGYAALLFSGPLKATNVVAFAPQISVNPTVVPFENRFGAYVPTIHFVFDDMPRYVSRTVTKHIVYDPFTEIDRKHVEMILAFDKTIPVRIPFSGHLPGQVLRDGGCLSDVVVDLLLNKPNQGERRQRVRMARRKSHRYFLERAVHVSRRGNFKEALRLVNVAYVLDPDSVATIETLSCILMMDASYYGLAHLMVRLILRERPDLGHYKDMQSLVWREILPAAEAVINKDGTK